MSARLARQIAKLTMQGAKHMHAAILHFWNECNAFVGRSIPAATAPLPPLATALLPIDWQQASGAAARHACQCNLAVKCLQGRPR